MPPNRPPGPANNRSEAVYSEVYQDAAIDGVPEDLVAGLMETAERVSARPCPGIGGRRKGYRRRYRGVTTLNGQKVGADYLRSSAQLESIGDGRYLLRLGGDPLRPIYAYTGAESDVPQKFVLDLRGKSATPEAIQAYQNNLTDVGAVAP
jgi:hypothetical protein